MRILLTCWLWIVCSLVHAQQGYKQGDKVPEMPVQEIINTSAQVTTITALQKDVTILDFFGTWCAPCIRALPVLDKLQKQYANRLSVILISTEEKKQLQLFISNHQPFTFPLVIDNKQTLTQLFRPPAYPYTVVMDRNGIVLAITEAASITPEKMDHWLEEKKQPVEQKSAPVVNTVINAGLPVTAVYTNPLTDLSRKFVYAAKTGNDTRELVQQLADLSFDSVVNGLASDNEKKAFWINLYNGFTQTRLKQNPERFTSRSTFYKSREMMIAGKKFSLDDIEHGILRRSSVKWSEGYLKKWFPSKTEKRLRVNKLDYRIHFSLNCGAKSCPPIASYDASALDKQLDIATKAYLGSEAEYNTVKNTVQLPAIMGWFRNDFGGKEDMRELLQKLGIVPEDKKPSIYFKTYDWTLTLNNYSH